MNSIRKFSTFATESYFLAETGKLWEAMGSKANTAWVATGVGTVMLTGMGAVGSGLYIAMDSRFKALDSRFAAVDDRFIAVDKRFDVVDKRFDVVDKRFDLLDSKVDTVNDKLNNLAVRIDAVMSNVDKFTEMVAITAHYGSGDET
jgi:hypothetical protein